MIADYITFGLFAFMGICIIISIIRLIHEYSHIQEDYQSYCFNCYCQGDIWNIEYRPYTFDEWLDKGKPENGGIKL